ncbi:MAG: hypothetical protein K5666_00900 [Bacilli bacterium]|nr:hypothetical protein [Bacilli bacterium]
MKQPVSKVKVIGDVCIVAILSYTTLQIISVFKGKDSVKPFIDININTKNNTKEK